VPLIALAGAGIAAVLLPDFAALLAPYGLLLSAKLMLFAALMALAALNKLRLAPALGRGEPGALPGSDARWPRNMSSSARCSP